MIKIGLKSALHELWNNTNTLTAANEGSTKRIFSIFIKSFSSTATLSNIKRSIELNLISSVTMESTFPYKSCINTRSTAQKQSTLVSPSTSKREALREKHVAADKNHRRCKSLCPILGYI